DPEEKYAVILGNEVSGVDDEVLKLCDGAIEIPQEGMKHSLNVSIAAGIVAWEFYKMISGSPIAKQKIADAQTAYNETLPANNYMPQNS
ncbi:MAG: TrmH family RNA methyltransferase, partial [Flavitalea sp.]